MRIDRIVITILSLTFAPLGIADTVYKSVDAEGNVTYSTTPPVDATQTESVPIAPGPTAEQRAAAEARMSELARARAEAREREAENEEERAESVADAQKRLDEARAALKDAQEERVGDWQHTAGGARFRSLSYRQRMSAAEERVERAEEALAQARRGR